MTRRQSLKALAESRGQYNTHVRWAWKHIPVWKPQPGTKRVRVWLGSVFEDWNSDVSVIGIEAPSRRAAEAGLRACLEALPLKRKG